MVLHSTTDELTQTRTSLQQLQAMAHRKDVESAQVSQPGNAPTRSSNGV